MTLSVIPPEQEQGVVAEYRGGKSLRQIARTRNVSTRPIQRVLKKHGVVSRPTGRHETAAIDKDEAQALRAEYDRGATVNALADRHDYPQAAVWRALESTGGVRKRGPGVNAFTDEVRAGVASRFLAGESQTALAVELGCGVSTVAGILRAAGVAAGEHGQRRERHHAWKGGRVVHPDGYVMTRPDADSEVGQAMKGVSGYVLEHRLVLAQHLGRPLEPWETVHHLNGAKDDNRLENLQLRSGRHGKGAAAQCADCGSRNIVFDELE